LGDLLRPAVRVAARAVDLVVDPLRLVPELVGARRVLHRAEARSGRAAGPGVALIARLLVQLGRARFGARHRSVAEVEHLGHDRARDGGALLAALIEDARAAAPVVAPEAVDRERPEPARRLVRAATDP